MSQLNVYRASAGSGKTYTLTREYLTYLLSDKSINPHSHILAVTFTNASTRDMKGKILEEMYKIVYDPTKSEHIKTLAEHFNTTEEEISQRTKKLLSVILKDYSMFQISTIDKFFLSIMRSFIRELSLNSNYEIELGKDDVLNGAINNMFTHLDDPNNAKLLEWLINYSIANVDDNKNWDVKRNIVSLSKDLFSEAFLRILGDETFFNQLNDKNVIGEYKNEMEDLCNSIEKTVGDLVEKIKYKLEKELHLETADFKSSWMKSVLKSVENIKSGGPIFSATALNNIVGENPSWFSKEWHKKDIDRDTQIQNVMSTLMPLLKSLAELDLTGYYTAKELKKSVYVLGILMNVREEIKAYTEEERLMVLANVGEVISQIISKSGDAPFIYEKVGTRLKHYMIDEFQDTSALQWQNFMPLITEALGQGEDSLIVGDVKQSIYRFRNSDWEILNTKIEEDLGTYFRSDTLKENHRSCERVIEFNNELMKSLSAQVVELFQDEEFRKKIKDAYADVKQKVAKNEEGEVKHPGGYAKVELFVHEDNQEDPLLQKTIDEVKLLHEEKRYPYGEIAILIRENKKGMEIANKLAEEKIPFISAKALDAKKSQSVQFLIALLTAITCPNDKANKFFVLEKYYSFTSPKDAVALAVDNLEAWESELFGENRSQILKGSLSTQVENLISHFDIATNCVGEYVYIQAFIDKVLEFEKRNGSDIVRFLEWWEDQNEIKIDLPEQDAVKIMTVHTSKGLEFENVIFPMWGDELGPGTGIKAPRIWCSTKGKPSPFSQLACVPMNYGNCMQQSIFIKEYEQEKMFAYVDNLNVTYVAFTRAKRNLFVFGEVKIDDKKKSKPIEFKETVSSYICRHINGIKAGEELSAEDARLLYEVGELEGKTVDGVNAREDDKHITIPTGTMGGNYSLKGANFRNVATEEGTAMHNLLSSINRVEDMESRVAEYIETGQISEGLWEREKRDIENFVAENRGWFSDEYEVLNEQDILTKENGKLKRPDRVMLKGREAIVVDYKFGNKKSDNYITQVREYMSYLRGMGYDTKGYICYIKLREREEVTL